MIGGGARNVCIKGCCWTSLFEYCIHQTSTSLCINSKDLPTKPTTTTTLASEAMPSYLITGASRGIGLGFLDTLSANPSNTVIGLVRNVPATQAKISSWNRSNIHLVPGDLADYESLKSAVDGVSAMTDGRLDYVIANAGVVSDEFDPLSAL